ncbi:MAG: exonuclease subunit SbcD, partial [Dehalococcoidia bacterium]|nr:exonuclease subunit SbcD [Dehalococcoidia bacterium]
MRELRLLHFSDLHLGVEGYGRLDPKTGLSTRLLDCLSALDTVVDDAIASRVDLVLFTGDAYKNRDPSPTHQRELAKRIGRLVQAGIPMYLLVGNHDLPNSANRAHAVEIFDTLKLPNVYVVARGGLITIETPSGPAQVFGVPWVFRSSVYKAEDDRELSIEEVNRRIRQLIFEGVGTASERVRRDIPAILAVHGHVDGAMIGAESLTMLGQ